VSKLTSHRDRARAIIECGTCGSDHQVSGDTFAEAEAKLTEANGFAMDSEGHIEHCPACEAVGVKPPPLRAEVEDDEEDEG
jgi:hypothetical protein